MNGKKVLPGTVFAIPGGEQFAVAKIIYVSEYFKDVILIRLFKKPSKLLNELTIPTENEDGLLYYTGIDSIKKGDWRYVGDQPVSVPEKAMSKRIVGGDVWIEDNHMGPATESDLAALKNMDIYGYRLIEKAVAKLA